MTTASYRDAIDKFEEESGACVCVCVRAERRGAQALHC